jgi:dTDP-4-dehydrorhamnose reductase
MRILVFGKTGQVASELQRHADVIALGREEADLSNPDACASAILTLKPDAVINAAAYTAVDKAEDDQQAFVVNGNAPAAMAKACAALNIPFVHISTDYVFDGSGQGAWLPQDRVNPVNAYGRSKLAGEDAIRAIGGAHAILRTSWVFSAHGNNFVKTMLRLSQTRDMLSIVADQIGGPTPASAIAMACLKIASDLHAGPGKRGTYHFSGSPDVSWADFAREIFVQAGLGTTVQDIPSSSYPTPAKRPANSRLDCSSLFTTFGIERPDWRVGLAEVVKDLVVKK